MSERKISFVCCFCEDPDADRTIPICEMDGEFIQQFWCHEECLLGAMSEHARDLYQSSRD